MPVSVILPCYNCEQFIGEAVQSILDQTYREFELFIIDDASTDRTQSIIRTFEDSRIKFIVKEGNKGLVESLNMGLQLAQYDYIAIMHGDDISLPNRLLEQENFLRHHPEVICCGSWIHILGTDNIIKYPTQSKEVHLKMLQANVVAHPSVMLNAKMVRAHNLEYNTAYHYGAEDYEFWQQLMKFGQIVNIPKVLLQYRLHENQKTELYKQRIIELTDTIRKQFYIDLLPGNTYDRLIHNYPDAIRSGFSFTDFSNELLLLSTLRKQNALTKTYDTTMFNSYTYLKEFYITRAFLVHQFSAANLFKTLLFHPMSLCRTVFHKIKTTVRKS